VLDKTIKLALTPALIQYGTRGSVMIDAAKMLPGVSLELAMMLAKLGPLRTSGWKMDRLTEAWVVTAKMFSLQTESTIRQEAPAIISSAGAVNYRESPMDVVRADMAAVLVKDEIHRVANAFNMDAKTLLMIIQMSAIIQSNTKVELTAGVVPGVGSSLELDTIAGIKSSTTTSTTQSSVISHTISAGVAATISAPIVNINPIIPVPPVPPTALVAPVVTMLPLDSVRTAEKMPQYNGQNAHGTVII
jgi:hypothetical protein